jgi:uncharacterized LabA/DUF88 family protein
MFKYKNQRVGVFVDVANMYHSAKNLYKTNVNFAKVLEVAIAKRQIIRAIAYVVKSDTKEEKHFFDVIAKQGFEINSKDLQIFSGGMKKADWDVGLTVDAIKMADKLDVVVLVSGDGDYIPLVSYLKNNKGCLVEVMAFGETTSSKLIEEADEFTNLSKNKKKFLINK